LAHKAEHAVDLDTGAIVGVTVHPADHGDTTTIEPTLVDAVDHLEAVAEATDAPVDTASEIVADKGYHSRRTVLELQTNGFRPYISEPARGRQSWIDQDAARDAVYANRRRCRGPRGPQLQRRRGELLERPNAHLYDTGGMRRVHLRGRENILKRLLIHAAGCNLGLWMRTLIGIGTPRGCQGRAAALLALLSAVWNAVTAWCRARSPWAKVRPMSSDAIAMRRHQLATG
jgi:transposase